MACVYWIHHPDHTDILTQGYIGFTSRLPSKRWSAHKSTAQKGRYKKSPLYNALRKYGPKVQFKVLILGGENYCLSIEKLSRPNYSIGWNLGIGGEAPMLGLKSTDATKDKIRRYRLGRKHTPEAKMKMSLACRGRTRTKEHAQKIGDATRGRKHTVEARLKMSKAQRGKKISEETRQKMIVARRKRMIK